MTVLHVKSLEAIGEALGDTHWQADLARNTLVSKGQITRFLGLSRRPDEDFCGNVKLTMVEKIEAVAKLLNAPGLPQADAEITAKAQKLILEATALLRRMPDGSLLKRRKPSGRKPTGRPPLAKKKRAG